MGIELESEEEENSWHVENGYHEEYEGDFGQMRPPAFTENDFEDDYDKGYDYIRATKRGERRLEVAEYSAEPGKVSRIGLGLGQTLYRMTRESWGAAKPGPRLILVTPVDKVLFTHTKTDTCTTREECILRCREIQKYYMDLGFTDLPYNYLIGGDGVVYHGRGWRKQAVHPPVLSKLNCTCLDIAYIGDFTSDPVPFAMLSAALDLLKLNVKALKLRPFFQVHSTLQPM